MDVPTPRRGPRVRNAGDAGPLLASCVALVIAQASTSAFALPDGPPAPESPRRLASAETKVFASLDLAFDTRSPPLDYDGISGSTSALRLRSFVRLRMSLPAFFEAVLPQLFRVLGPKDAGLRNPFVVLETTKKSDRTVYSLKRHRKTCSRVVRVRPWWKPDAPIRICESSYRPDVTSYGGRSCEAPTLPLAEKESTCGCGPYLMNCFANVEQQEQFAKAAELEPIRTMEFVIRARRPFSEILTMNQTVRSGILELHYSRNRFFHTGSFTPIVVSAPETLLARDPEFDGGVLTTLKYLSYDESVRLLIGALWDDFLCAPFSSARVDAAQVFAPSAVGSWVRYTPTHKLAKLEVCRDCHARLEGAFQAFAGFGSAFFGLHHRPERDPSRGNTEFYVGSWRDLRGVGPASPMWVGQMIGRMPEFNRCIVTKVEEFVYGGEPVSADIDRTLLASFGRGQDLAQLIEDTVVARYAGIGALGASAETPTR